jgi:hypothetical protein
MKRTINCYVTFRPPRWKDGKPEIDLYTFDPRKYESSADVAVVREMPIEIEVPDDFDPRPQLVANLEAAKLKARAEFAAKVTEIDRRISELLCLEMA